MATQSREPTAEEENERGLLGQIEVHSIDWIPDTERHGKTWQQTMLWFLGNFQYFTIPIGFVGPALGLSLGWSILAGVLGIWFGTLFMAFHATQGPVFGLPQMIQTRAQMGYRGVVVALFAVLFTYMAFNVADQVLLASGLNGAFGWNPDAGRHRHRDPAAALAIFGYDWVHRVFRFLLVISFPCYAIISVAILVGHAGGHAPGAPRRVRLRRVHVPVLGGRRLQHHLRAVRLGLLPLHAARTRPRSIIAAVFFGASGSAIWLIALGAWLATRLNISDGLVGLQKSGDNVAAPLGSITAFLSATALLATMGMNAYGGMLTVLTGIDSFKTIRTSRVWRAATVLVLAAIWYGIGQSISTSGSDTAVSAVLNSLTLMLYLLVPWTALNLVDFFFVRRGHYAITDIFRPDGVYGAWGWRGLTAYFAGFAAEIPFMVLPPIAGFSYTGYFPNHVTNGVDYSWVVGLLVSGLVYLVLSRSLDLASEQAAIAASEQELQTIDEGMSMTEPVRRIITGDTVGPVDATAVPRYGGEATFARLPRLQDVARADVAIVGVPFDSGVSYRPGARFGPSHIRESSRLLRPYNPALQVPVFARQQVADAGDLAVNPFSIDEAIGTVERGARALLERAPFVLTLGGDHTIALPMLRAVSAVHGPVAVVHFDAHLDTWDTYFGAAYTHGTPFRRASEEGLLDRTGCVHAGIRGPLYSDADLTEDAELGFQVVSAPEVEHIGVTGLIERIAARVGDRPVYVSVDIDVLDPAHAPGTGTPEAGGLTSRELLATLRSFAALNLVGADIVEVAPAYDHAQITGIAAAHVAYELLSALAARQATP